MPFGGEHGFGCLGQIGVGDAYINRGGTLDVTGMLIANRSTWVNAIYAAAQVTGWNNQRAAVDGSADQSVPLRVESGAPASSET